MKSQSLGQEARIMTHLQDIVDEFRPDVEAYEATYRHLHQNPELSMLESATSALARAHLERLGFDEVIGQLGS